MNVNKRNNLRQIINSFQTPACLYIRDSVVIWVSCRYDQIGYCRTDSYLLQGSAKK